MHGRLSASELWHRDPDVLITSIPFRSTSDGLEGLGEESESRSQGMKPGIGERVLNSVRPDGQITNRDHQLPH
jgi:hypothetical protein